MSISGRESENSQVEKVAEHLWQSAHEKSTLHALVIRSLSEARQRCEGCNKETELDEPEAEDKNCDEEGMKIAAMRHLKFTLLCVSESADIYFVLNLSTLA